MIKQSERVEYDIMPLLDDNRFPNPDSLFAEVAEREHASGLEHLCGIDLVRSRSQEDEAFALIFRLQRIPEVRHVLVALSQQQLLDIATNILRTLDAARDFQNDVLRALQRIENHLGVPKDQ